MPASAYPDQFVSSSASVKRCSSELAHLLDALRYLRHVVLIFRIMTEERMAKIINGRQRVQLTDEKRSKLSMPNRLILINRKR